VNIVSNLLQTLGSVKPKPYSKVRLEGGSIVSQYVHPLYGKPLKILFDRCVLISHKQFVEVYNFCNKGHSLKCFRLSKDFQEKEVQELFGPCVSKNGY
jgi:hypothetical protein